MYCMTSALLLCILNTKARANYAVIYMQTETSLLLVCDDSNWNEEGLTFSVIMEATDTSHCLYVKEIHEWNECKVLPIGKRTASCQSFIFVTCFIHHYAEGDVKSIRIFIPYRHWRPRPYYSLYMYIHCENTHKLFCFLGDCHRIAIR
jgi:hypothetical protein